MPRPQGKSRAGAPGHEIAARSARRGGVTGPLGSPAGGRSVYLVRESEEFVDSFLNVWDLGGFWISVKYSSPVAIMALA